MTSKRQYSKDELNKLGIHMEAPEIELPQAGEIDVISENAQLDKVVASEAFMNERVRIRMATTTDPNAPPYAILTVNDVHNRVVVPRGQAVYVKRLHVEVLARMRETRFTQPVRNMADPESGNQLIPANAMAYPFEVLEDKNPVGREWLERLLSEPA